MNESLADLRHLGACEDQMDVMPNLDTITSNHGSVYKGYLQVPVFGGGTANTEYEALTGNCMAFWDNWTIAYQVYSQEKEYAMTGILKEQGYETLAMHPQNHQPMVSLNMDQDYPQAEEYLSLVKESDEAFGDLIAYFQEYEEPTMIIMFGDHLPNLLDGFYDELAGKTSLSTEEFYRRQYQTPYIIWTNYEISMPEIPLMSVNFFGNYILENIGSELSDYNEMSLNVLDQIPVINEQEVMMADGTWMLKEGLDEEQKKLLNDYEVMQYNEVFANGKRVDKAFAVE